MLAGVHRQARPRADVDVLVVQVVDVAVERPPVQQAMDEVAVNLAPHGDCQEDQGEGHRLGPPVEPDNETVGVAPQHEDLVGGPHGNPARDGPKDVVPQLVAPQEGGVSLGQPIGVVLVLGPLALEREQPEVPAAGEQHHQPEIARVDLGDPIDAEGGGS